MASRGRRKEAEPTTAAFGVEPEKRGEWRRALGAWFEHAGRDLPWRRTRDPYAVLVSEFMLQQTQVGTVVPYYERWMQRFPDAAALARAPEADVLRAWEGLGYYARARNLHRAARAIVEEHGGRCPEELSRIAALPGVGRYTAGAVASFAFDLPAAAVDANIARVLARWLNLSTPLDTAAGQAAVWTTAETLVPTPDEDGGPRRWNSALMELGALVCRARAPACLVCPAQGWCGAFAAGAPEAVPVKAARRATVALDEPCAWTVSPGLGLLLQQGTAGARWRGLWKLPPFTSLPASTGDQGEGDKKEKPLFQLVYPFTHHRVTLRVFDAPAPAALAEGQRWWPFTQLEHAAMAAPHRRAVRALLGGGRAAAPSG